MGCPVRWGQKNQKNGRRMGCPVRWGQKNQPLKGKLVVLRNHCFPFCLYFANMEISYEKDVFGCHMCVLHFDRL